MKQRPLNRRQFLTQALFGSGLLGLRAVVSGLPPLALAHPEAFVASLSPEAVRRKLAAAATPQYLILSTSDAGEPLNCNVPGMYSDPNLKHPTAPSMAATSFALGSAQVTAAKVWSTLPTSALARLNFFHLATGNFQHGGLGEVHTLNGQVANNEMMVSALSAALHPLLGTIQAQPLVIGGGNAERISYRGAQQPVFSPTFIRDLLTTPDALASFNATQALRDRDLDALNAALKVRADPTQQALIDAYATSQEQACKIPQTLLAQLATIQDDGIQSQATAAALLCQLKLAPAVLVDFPFGGDNHSDTDSHNGPGALPAEAAQHVSSVAAISTLMGALSSQNMLEAVTFATLTTFGRSNAPDLNGRSHNGQHSCNLLIGPHVQAGVVGGATLVGDNPVAQGIDPTTGQGISSAGIQGADTLASYGATLGRALGLPQDTVQSLIPGSQAVSAALAGL